MPFEERAAERASHWPIQEGSALFTCSAEDLIVHKTFADREKDWLDIEGVAVRQAGALNEGLIWRELDPLLVCRELAVHDAVRLVSLGAEAAMPVRFVVLTVPLEPHDAAVPLEGEHVGRRFMRGVQGRVTRTRR